MIGKNVVGCSPHNLFLIVIFGSDHASDIYHKYGPAAGAVNIHLGPGEQFALVARLDKGRRAEAFQEQVGWYEFRIGPGEVGWIRGTAVALNEFC